MRDEHVIDFRQPSGLHEARPDRNLRLRATLDSIPLIEGEYRIGLPEVTLGLLPGNGGTQRLSRLIGRTRALDMMLTSQQVNATRALELGMVERVFPADRVAEEAVDYVAKLAKGPTLAIGNIKIATRLGADLPLEGALALEREAVWRLFMSADAAEGLAAFGEKRAPNWTGR